MPALKSTIKISNNPIVVQYWFLFGGNASICNTRMYKMGSSVKAGDLDKPSTPRDVEYGFRFAACVSCSKSGGHTLARISGGFSSNGPNWLLSVHTIILSINNTTNNTEFSWSNDVMDRKVIDLYSFFIINFSSFTSFQLRPNCNGCSRFLRC